MAPVTAPPKKKAGRRGEGGGRPRADPAKVREGMRLVNEEQYSPDAAAERAGIGAMTLRRALKDPSSIAPAPASSSPVKPETLPAPDLAIVRRILKARDPAALAELDAGLAEAAKGPGELDAWLARPLARPEPIDPLDAATRALEIASAWVTQLPPTHPKAAQFLTLIGGLAKTAERINGARPQAPTADEVSARIAARADDAVKKIFEYTEDARKKLDADRADLAAWARANLGPLIAEELGRRVDAMLAGAPS